jgi:hypothetical protein
VGDVPGHPMIKWMGSQISANPSIMANFPVIYGETDLLRFSQRTGDDIVQAQVARTNHKHELAVDDRRQL